MSPTDPGCIFCRIVSGEIALDEARIASTK